LRSLFKLESKKGLNVRLVESLVNRLDLNSNGKVVIELKFGVGDFLDK
jgi:hypothetical protein